VVGGKYRIVRLIGDGGMGAVYEARHEILGSAVALKFLHAELARRPGLASRFLQEARVSASIQSPHVTRVTDVDQMPDGSPYLVMELLTGESLQQLLDRRHKLPKDQSIDFALQILSGLEAAHALGVVHRDLKPDNVFITPSTGGPVLKLLDFGIAKLRQTSEFQRGLTRPGAIMGTPEYMAPEQLYAADKVDHRADLYSLGAILYEMLTGERPAYGDDAHQIIGQVAAGKVKRITEHDHSLGEELGSVVHRSVDPDKNHRYSSALDMRLALAPFAGQLSHAGRLAATPAPASVIPDKTEETGAPPPTMDGPELPAKPSVAPTLPPEDEPQKGTSLGGPPATFGSHQAGVIKGGTQEASKELIRELTGQAPARQEPLGGYGASAHGVSYPGPGGHMPPRARKAKGSSGALIALLLGVLVTGGIIAIVVLAQQSGGDDDAEPVLGGGDLAPATTISAQGGAETPPDLPPPTTPVTPETPGPGPKPTGTGTGKPKPKDGGADSGGTAPWSFPTAFPSSFPPMPSGLPPLPTFPGIPGLPGQPPPDENN
jgi:eukaryotic-like serine/threonine-protein kinase